MLRLYILNLVNPLFQLSNRLHLLVSLLCERGDLLLKARPLRLTLCEALTRSLETLYDHLAALAELGELISSRLCLFERRSQLIEGLLRAV